MLLEKNGNDTFKIKLSKDPRWEVTDRLLM